MKNPRFFTAKVKTLIGLMLFLPGIQNVIAQQICNSNQVGTQNGYRHELWSQAGEGNGCMTLGPGATFSAEWSNITNFLARRGLGYDETREHQEIGTFNASYTVDYEPDCSVGLSYMGVYGWAYEAGTDDLVEYYIIEDWCNWIPSMDSNAESMGSIWASGSYYDVIRVPKYNAPSIKGDRDFMQYFSIRRDTRNSGLINVSEHFYHWEKLGMPLGNLDEVSMLVEGYEGNGNGSGKADFTTLDVYRTDNNYAQQIHFVENSWNLSVGDLTSKIEFYATPLNSEIADYEILSSNPAVVSIGVYKGNYYLQANSAGSATISITSLTTTNTDTASVTVNLSGARARLVQFRALGVQGDEQLNLLLDGSPVGTRHTLSSDFQVYNDILFGEGDISVEFVNDDGVANGRDVRLDYISVDGEKRETEQMAGNSAAYANGTCGGGGYTEWLHCNGSVDFGYFNPNHTITIRARGNAGGEHINLLIDGRPVNAGWWLGTGFQQYTATVAGDGDINVQFDNDGGLKDVIIDWVKVDSQTPRQAENMQYNTGAYANGQCGGGSYTQWLHCNGVIGFGNISDNFN